VATTVEVSPSQGPRGTVFTINIVDAPVSGGPWPRPTSDLCSLSIEGDGNGVGVGFTVNKRNQTVKFDSGASLEPGQEGQYAVKLFKWDDFTDADAQDKILASAVLIVDPA